MLQVLIVVQEGRNSSMQTSPATFMYDEYGFLGLCQLRPPFQVKQYPSSNGRSFQCYMLSRDQAEVERQLTIPAVKEHIANC